MRVLDMAVLKAQMSRAELGCRLGVQREEAALQAWLNSLLAPVKDGIVAQQAALAGRRLTARMRGLLWHLYSRDAELTAVMMRVEARIDSGHLRIRDEVRPLHSTAQHRRSLRHVVAALLSV
jgi:abnormal spindle-like microcephaly-associated protein